MTTTIASLIVSLEASTAKLIGQMEHAEREVTKSLSGIRSAGNLVKGALASIGVGLSVGAITNWTREVVASTSALDDFADQTGSSVENLSKIVNQAKISGVEFGTLQTLVLRLAAGMAGVEEEGSKVGRALSALGVDAKDPAEALQEVALALDKYEDGTAKAALARDLFGKGGPAFLAVLKDMAKAHDVAATVTTQQAQEAERLEQGLRRLELEGITPLKNAILNGLVPALNDMVTGFLEARKAGLGFLDSIAVASSSTDIVARITSQKLVVENYRKELEALKKHLAENPGLRAGLVGPIEELTKKVERAEKALAAFIAVRDRMAFSTAGYTGDKFDQMLGTSAASKSKAVLDYTGASENTVKKTTDAYAQLRAELLRSQAALDGLTDSEKIELEIMKGGILPAQAEELRFLAATNDYLRQQADLRKSVFEDEMRRLKEQADAELEAGKAKVRNIESLDKFVEGLEFEARALTMTNRERSVEIALRTLEANKIGITSEALEEYRQRIVAAVDAKEGLQQQIQLWEGIEGAAHDAFIHIWEEGKGVFDRLTEALKRGLLELLYQMTIKKWIIQIGAEMTGNAGILGGVSSLFGGGSNPLSALTSLFGGGEAAATGWMTGAGDMLGGGLGSAFGMAEGAGLLSTIGSIAPYALAAYAAYSLLAPDRGGPKQGGSAGYGGFYPGELTSGGNTQMEQLKATITARYNQIVAAAGGKATGDFTFGFDTDPEGTAGSRVSSGATVGGRSVYNVRDLDVGRDSAALEAAINTESKRALLAALQASDLPKDIADVFNSISAATASDADIDRILALGTALSSLNDVFNASPLDDALEAIKQESEGAYGAFERAGESMRELVDAYDGSVEATDGLVAATQAYYNSLVQLLIQVEKVKTEISEMFSDTIRSMTLQTLDPQAKYQFLQNETESLKQQLLSAKDPETVKMLAAKINSNLNEAFGLLSPDQQRALLPTFIANTQEINAQVNKILTDIGNKYQSDTNMILTEVRETLRQVAADNQNAANTQVDAANTQLAAARTPLQVTSTVVLTGTELTK